MKTILDVEYETRPKRTKGTNLFSYILSGGAHENELINLMHQYDLSIADLARYTELYYSDVRNLIYGFVSPIYLLKNKYGRLKPSAQKLCDFFIMEPHEVFPNHYCVIPGIKDDDILDIDFDSWSSKHASFDYVEHIYQLEFEEDLKKMQNMCTTMSRDIGIFIATVVHEVPSVEIAQIESRSATWVKQRIDRARYKLYDRSDIIKTDYERDVDMIMKLRESMTWDSRRPKPELKIKPIGHKQRTKEDVLWEKVLYNVRHRSDLPHRHMRNLIIHLDIIEQQIEESRREQCTASLFDKQELVQQIKTLLGRSDGYEILLEDYRRRPYAIY